MKTTVILLSVLLTSAVCFGGSATWNLNPTNTDWDTASNWTPATVPNGPSDVATFDVSNTPAISVVFPPIEVDSVVYNSGGTPISVTVGDNFGSVVSHLTLSGGGIANNSGVIQQFFANPTMERENDPDNVIIFEGGATAGNLTQFTAMGASNSSARLGGEIRFMGTSSAGSGNFINATGKNGGYNGFTRFWESSTAGNGIFTNKASTSSTDFGGATIFSDTSNAGAATFTNEPSLAGDIGVPIIIFFSSSSAANGNFVSMGGTMSGAGGGRINFYDNATASNATLTINGGSNGGGGSVLSFVNSSLGGTARVELFGNGNLDITGHDAPGVTIGSVEGDGLVFLGARTLTVGSNNLNTNFSGVIADGSGGAGGSLTKIGTGKLVLSGVNTYTGPTIVNGGVLVLRKPTGAGSRNLTGPVTVPFGTLAGNGRIGGTVSIGDGSGTGSVLAPGLAGLGMLTIDHKLTFFTDGTYDCELNSRTLKSDRVTANRVAIAFGTHFSLTDLGDSTLSAGTIFTIINNTSSRPITGVFANLFDGGTIMAGSNTFQANYEGGDGNDLTLTVQ